MRRCSSRRKLSSIDSGEAGSSWAVMTSSAIRPASSASSRGRLDAGSSGARAARRRRGAPSGERWASVRRARYSLPSSGRAMHIASRARSRRSREVSSAARRGRRRRAAARRAPASAGPPLSGCAATTRPITIAGSRSSRSATRRTRSSRLALSPIPARIGATSASARSRSAGEPTSVRVEHQPDLEGGQLDRAVDQRPEALRPALGGHHLGRVLARRHRRHPQPHLAPRRDPLRPQHRLLPGRVGVERQHHLLDHPRERGDLLVGDRRAHHPDRLLDPGLVQGQHVRVALDHDRPARLGDRRLGQVDAVEHLALVEEVGLGRVDVLRPLVGAHRPAAEAERAAAAVADREHDPRAEAVVLAPAPPLLDQPDPAQLVDLEPGPLAAQQHLVPGARRVADREGAQHLLASPRSRQVLARLGGLVGVPEVAGVEGRGAVEQLAEAAALLRAAPPPAGPPARAPARPRSARRAAPPPRRSPAPPSPR